MNFPPSFIPALAIGFLFPFSTFAGVPLLNGESYVVNSAGGSSSNGTYTNISCVGQGTPVGLNTATNRRNKSGFLTTFVLHPLLDLDNDGVPDEDDVDDDNDSLTDLAEITGVGDPSVATDPDKVDTDGDGSSDAEEIEAGTNPTDPNSLLHLTISLNGAGEPVLDWPSRSGKTYVLLRSDTLQGLINSPTLLGPFSPVGGIAPWFETSSTFTDTTAPPNPRYFYQVRLAPP